jgi:NAD(P)-dependent dehydrogenase (short-subunit alcohol dehydrogenase family)
VKVNLVGVLYTIKLALHYFRRQHAQNKENPRDQLLVLQGSLAGYLDLPGALQYTATKFGLRGMMRDLRQTEYAHNIRVNYIGPW